MLFSRSAAALGMDAVLLTTGVQQSALPESNPCEYGDGVSGVVDISWRGDKAGDWRNLDPEEEKEPGTGMGEQKSGSEEKEPGTGIGTKLGPEEKADSRELAEAAS